MQRVRVMTPLIHFPYGDYLSDGDVGDVVVIPILDKKYLGVIIDVNVESPFQLKKAEKTNFKLTVNYIKYLQDFALYNITYPNKIINTILDYFSSKVKPMEQKLQYPTILLNEEQTLVFNEFVHNKNQIFLLYGITGSGKTETFFSMAIEILKLNKQVLLILPEIVLSEAIRQRFRELFHEEPVIWNSENKNKTKFMAIVTGKAKFIIGTRSSIFIPFHNLGMIIIDEEHDKTHQQQEGLQYNCREAAVLLGTNYHIPVILVSATPSLESYYNATIGKYKLLRLHTRYGGQLPTIHVLKTLEILPNKTLEKCKQIFEKKQQVIFFLNRRGFANYIVCTQCNSSIVCKKCETSMVWHKTNNVFICHRCCIKTNYESCPECNAIGTISCLGYGVEKITFLLQQKFPDQKIVTLSSDTYDRENIQNFIEEMSSGKIDCVVGTQLITKGLDFGGVALVVVLNFNKNGFDFRLWEHTFQMLVQISGRAGRRNNHSEVLIQTSGRTPIGQYITTLDYEQFLFEELENRKIFNLPPFTKIIGLLGDIKPILESLKNVGIILTNNNDRVYIKIKIQEYIIKAALLRSILKNSKTLIKVLIDPIDILY